MAEPLGTGARGDWVRHGSRCSGPDGSVMSDARTLYGSLPFLSEGVVMPAIRFRPRTVLVLLNLFAFLGAFSLQFPSSDSLLGEPCVVLPLFALSCVTTVALLIAFGRWFFCFFMLKANDVDADEYGLLMKQLAIACGGLLMFLFVLDYQRDYARFKPQIVAAEIPAALSFLLGTSCCVTLHIVRRCLKPLRKRNDPTAEWGRHWTPSDDARPNDD